MIKPWITLPVAHISVQLPMSIFEGDIKIMFKDVETIDNAIEQLQNLKELLKETGGII